jgi:DNA phosphorothioation-dependent restriction protein DptH
MLPENAPMHLAEAFAHVLGTPERGAMAFARCLSGEVLRALTASKTFNVPGWQVAAVVDQADPASRCIRADQSVEWRENKTEANLLLVDQVTAGAGMDGIYSAAREISEETLFATAIKLVSQRLPHGYKGFANKALRKAGWGSRRHPLAPWSAFSYLCQAEQDPKAVGGALPRIGLWPLRIDGKPDETDLDKASLLAERLLPAESTRLSPEQRASSLKLGKDEKPLEDRLAGLLRKIDYLPRLEALRRLEDEPELWLNRLNPGIFDGQALHEITWIPWRGRTGRPLNWSGLSVNS